MQQRIVKTPDAASFLGLVPTLVGMEPVESLVLVVFRGSRTCGALRMDLPRLAGDVAVKRFTNTLIGMVCRVDGADGVVPVAYTGAPFAVAPRALLLRLAGRARTAGLAVKDLLVVAGDAWGSLLDPDLPPEGRSLQQIAAIPLDGEPPLLDPAAALRLPVVPPDSVRRFAVDLAAWRSRPDGTGADLHGLDPGARGAAFGRRMAGRPFVERVLAGLDLGPAIEGMLEPHPEGAAPCRCLALLAALVERPVLRDLVMLQVAWGPEFGAHVRDRTLLHDGGPLDAEEPVTLAFSGGDMPRPDQRRIETALQVVALTAAHLPVGERAPLFAVAAWLHWAQGHGSIAGAFADRAAREDPGYPFAHLLGTLFETGALPEWAFREQPLGEAGRAWLRSPA
ncbi:MAG: hypothetical protein QOC59_723 [Microbacteriaceae bacterium]|nr:hypothetical protein [Microbacteriaceae bacterium]